MSAESSPPAGQAGPVVGAQPLDAFGRLRAALVSALQGGDSGGVGCHYWIRPTFGVPVDQLEVLGLAKTIRQRVPACEEHGCAILATCSERISFAERRAGISRWKFRLTALGVQAAAEPNVLARQIADQPLARRILDVLSGASGPTSWLSLYWRLLEPELTALEETGQRPVPPLSRPTVRFYLDLLVTAGLVSEDAERGEVASNQSRVVSSE